jgi:sortase (surface protein transpeptidase)
VPADRRVAAGLASLTLALVLGACGESPARPGASPATAPPATTAPTTTAAAPSSTRPARARKPSPPVWVEIPSIGVSSRLIRLGLNADGTMEVPRDYGLAGWFTGGAMPGQDGPAVISGHVDSKSGPAVFYRLRELRPGDLVEVVQAGGARVRFAVERTEQVDKRRFPTADVYYPTLVPRLRLVTCGGSFDPATGHYRSNLIVYAALRR